MWHAPQKPPEPSSQLSVVALSVHLSTQAAHMAPLAAAGTTLYQNCCTAGCAISAQPATSAANQPLKQLTYPVCTYNTEGLVAHACDTS
jgi:hypothetical protein